MRLSFLALTSLTLTAALALTACGKPPAPTQSLVGAFPAPGTYALAGDTLTVWRRVEQPGGGWRFHSWSITPGGTVEELEELERLGAPADPEQAQDFSEKRHAFTLPQAEFEAIRSQAALLRPQALGPEDPVAGYAGEAHPIGCAADPAQPRVAGINFLNGGNWGAFVLHAGCTGMGGDAARAAMDRIFARLERASHPKAP